jgi:hypothetical protein
MANKKIFKSIITEPINNRDLVKTEVFFIIPYSFYEFGEVNHVRKSSGLKSQHPVKNSDINIVKCNLYYTGFISSVTISFALSQRSLVFFE